MTYRVDMETSVGLLRTFRSPTRKVFWLFRADAVIGLASDTVGKAERRCRSRVVTERRLRRSPAVAVHLELQKMTYMSAAQSHEGGESAQQSIGYDTGAAADPRRVTHPLPRN